MASMSLTGEQLKPLTVNQIKKVSSMMDKAIVEANKKLDDTEKERNAGLREMGNHLHPTCHVSDNEVCLCATSISCFRFGKSFNIFLTAVG
jgi:seryl-tRNA synthetase